MPSGRSYFTQQWFHELSFGKWHHHIMRLYYENLAELQYIAGLAHGEINYLKYLVRRRHSYFCYFTLSVLRKTSLLSSQHPEVIDRIYPNE